MGLASRRIPRISKIERTTASFPCSAGILRAVRVPMVVAGAGSFDLAQVLRKFPIQPLLANQLFSMLPSSNTMGARRKLERGSQRIEEKKGACQWNHGRQHSGWLATTPAEHRSLSNALQFLIANLELDSKM